MTCRDAMLALADRDVLKAGREMDKYQFYRFLAPFRMRRQRSLCRSRGDWTLTDFMGQLPVSPVTEPLARGLWDLLRDAAFVPDFRVDASDLLDATFGMGPEEVSDDLTDPLLDQLGLDVSMIDFTGLDFRKLKTVGDVAKLMIRVEQLARPCISAKFSWAD